MSDKPAERTQLILTLGRLLAPLHELVSADPPPGDRDYQVAVARFHADLQRWRPAAHAFTKVGKVDFGRELDDILRPLGGLPDAIANSVRSKPTAERRREHLQTILGDVERVVIQAIDSLPFEWESRLLEERTPFASHLHIHDAIRSARRRVHFFDRYLEPSVYDLYLRELDRQIEVRLVSTAGGASYGTRSLEAAGRLAAKEFRDLQVIACQPSSMHDRNLRVDDAIFFLGPSLKDIGRYPTNFALTASTSDAHRVLDALIAGSPRVV